MQELACLIGFHRRERKAVVRELVGEEVARETITRDLWLPIGQNAGDNA